MPLANFVVIPPARVRRRSSCARTDTTSEGPERVVLELKSGAGYKVDATKVKAVVTIIDAQKPTLSVEAADESVDEDDANGTSFRITRDGSTSGGSLTVKYAIGGTAAAGSYTLRDEDGNVLAGDTLTIPAGEAYIDVLLTPKDNDEETGDRTVTFSVLADENYLGEPSASITIKDDEAA